MLSQIMLSRLIQLFPFSTVSYPASHIFSLFSCCDEDSDGVSSRAKSRASSGAFLSKHNSTKHGATPDAEGDVLIEEGSKVEGTGYYIMHRDSVLVKLIQFLLSFSDYIHIATPFLSW